MPLFRNTIRRSGRERARRIDRAFEILLKSFLVCYFLFVFSAWLSYCDIWRISEIQIDGTHAVDATLVKSAVEAQLARHMLWKIDRNNVVLYPWLDMHSAIMMLDTRVKAVAIKVEGKRITIRVSEYVSAFLWCPLVSDFGEARSLDATVATTTAVVRGEKDGVHLIGCSFADETGHIFAPAPEYSGSPFIVFATTMYKENNGSILAKEEFNKVNVFLAKLEELGLIPRLVREAGAHDFTITTDRSWEVRWSSVRDPDADARTLTLVLQNLSGDHLATDTLKTIDLRFGNKVFYR